MKKARFVTRCVKDYQSILWRKRYMVSGISAKPTRISGISSGAIS